MDAPQLRAVAQQHSAILIAGVQERRLEPVLVALRGGLVSALVTNLNFAWKVLESYAAGAASMGQLTQ